MAVLAIRLLNRSAAPLACALGALCATPAHAGSGLRLFTPDTLELTADVRALLVDGEDSWLEGGFGKLRSGGTGSRDFRLKPQLGNVNLVWKPQFTWSLSGTVVGSLQGGERTEAGLSQAYLSFRPMRLDKLAVSARAGLMWPPISLEHEGADWHVTDSITPSAINSWVGEEVRPVAAEGTLAATLGEHRLRATAAVMAANDTAGTLLSFRGWALHDRTTLAFRRSPLPPFDIGHQGYQAPFTHPLLDVHGGFAHRPGYYAKLSWQPPVPVRIELFRYDNRANPQDVNADLEWGWRTRFDQLAAVAELGAGAELKAQALSGHTKMGFPEGKRRWVDARFRSAFLSFTRPFGPFGLSIRAEAFEVRNHGAVWDSEYDDKGWSAMIAGKRDWGRLTGLVELLHVSSSRDDRLNLGLRPRQRQTQLQAELRTRW
ncbi:MAG TPA: hypothetical protein VM145_07345 [Sphingomicrobium sp.]|nr:hypothetical protein [Sphingomicrobium sp.]